MIMFNCPKCGYINNDNIKLYSSSLRKQSFGISPILPTCLLCGSETTFNISKKSPCLVDPNDKNDRRIIILTGTCASGKSAIAEALMNLHGFDGIDGDCVMQVVKHKLGVSKVEYNVPEMYDEIALEIDLLISLQKDIVISHVITPSDIDIYRQIFKHRNLYYKIFLLQPPYSTAVARSKTRTCHNSITPEEWVKYFYDELSVFENLNNEDLIIFDNSDYSVEESVDRILEINFNMKRG